MRRTSVHWCANVIGTRAPDAAWLDAACRWRSVGAYVHTSAHQVPSSRPDELCARIALLPWLAAVGRSVPQQSAASIARLPRVRATWARLRASVHLAVAPTGQGGRGGSTSH